MNCLPFTARNVDEKSYNILSAAAARIFLREGHEKAFFHGRSATAVMLIE
jgi:hypothetical protein